MQLRKIPELSVRGFRALPLPGIEYDAKTISIQLAASKELGIDEYIIWNASNNYDPLSFFYGDQITERVRQSGQDRLSRTPGETLAKYLDAVKYKRYSLIYLLTPIAERPEDYDEFVSEIEKNPVGLKKYDIVSINTKEDGSFEASVSEEFGSDTGDSLKKDILYRIVLENEVYKVIKEE